MYGNAIATIAAHENHRARSELALPVEPGPEGGDEEQQHPEVGHHAHRPVVDDDVRGVVAPAELMLLAIAGSRSIPSTLPLNEPVAMYESSRGIVIEKLGVGFCAEKPPNWMSEKPHGWQVCHCASEVAIFMSCALVTASPKRFPTTSWSSVTGTATISASFAALTEEVGVRAAQEVPAAHAEHHVVPKISPARIDVHVRAQREAVGEQRPDARQLRLAVDDLVADGVLHPRVRDEDEVARQPRSDHRDPERRQMEARRQPVPTEDPQAEERRLEEEGGEPLDRERRAEDVADEPRVDRPVHAELELLHEPGRDADREVDQEQRPEEARQAEPLLVLRAQPERLHDRDERSRARGSAGRTGSGRSRSSRTAGARGRRSWTRARPPRPTRPPP